MRLGLDLSDGDIACALADEAGAVQLALRAPLSPTQDAPARWLALMELARETLRRAEIAPSHLTGCALAFPGAVDAQGVVAPDTRLAGWNNFDLPRALREHLGVTNAVAENRLLCAALGEQHAGALRADETFDGRDWLFVVLGSSIGAVVGANGTVLRGADGASGALGALCIERDGALSGGGRRGGLDAYCSPEGLNGRASGYGLGGKSLRELWDLAPSNFAAQSLRDEFVSRLAQGLGAALCLFNPRRAVLGGSLAREAGTPLLDALKLRLPDFCLPIHARNLQLRGAELGHDAALMGAVALAVPQAAV